MGRARIQCPLPDDVGYGERCSDKRGLLPQAAFVDYRKIVESVGGEFLGVQKGPETTLILFADPQSRSTLAVREESFSAESLLCRIEESRLQYSDHEQCVPTTKPAT